MPCGLGLGLGLGLDRRWTRQGGRRCIVPAITPDGGTCRVLHDMRDHAQNTRDPAPDGLTGCNPVTPCTSAAVVDHVRAGGGAPGTEWDGLKTWEIR